MLSAPRKGEKLETPPRTAMSLRCLCVYLAASLSLPSLSVFSHLFTPKSLGHNEKFFCCSTLLLSSRCCCRITALKSIFPPSVVAVSVLFSNSMGSSWRPEFLQNLVGENRQSSRKARVCLPCAPVGGLHVAGFGVMPQQQMQHIGEH